jgi:hypothetical protein
MPGGQKVLLHASGQLPADLPPGIYRLRLDVRVAKGGTNYTLNGDGFASQPFFRGVEPQSYVYSPTDSRRWRTLKGDPVIGASIQPRIPWVLLNNYNSNGYHGVVADEDSLTSPFRRAT